MTTAVSVGQKLWNYCNVLRDAGLSHGDYLEQLTYLIFPEDDGRAQPAPLHPAFRLPLPRPSPKDTTGPACWPGRATRWRHITATPWRIWPSGLAPWG